MDLKMESKYNILLTGASGTVGIEVLKQLASKKPPFRVTAFDLYSKRSAKLLAPFRKTVEIVFGNLSNPNDLKKACCNQDIVIHLAAVIPPQADEKPDLAHKVNTIGTENLLRCLETHSPKAFIIYSSSISVYGDRVTNPSISAEDPLLPSEGDRYARTKMEAERLICQSNLDWSIFRLTAIMKNHKLSKLMFHMPLNTALEILTPEDTARALIHAIDQREAISKKIFNLGGGEKCRTTYHEFLSRSFEIAGLGRLDFPRKAFAEKNFHCGYYSDGDKLENILHFRRDTMDSYYEEMKKSTPKLQKAITRIFKNQIKQNLLRKSEPYQAFIHNDPTMSQHFFHVPPNENTP